MTKLKDVKGGSGQWSARCPAHDDQHGSLSISTGQDGRILLKCHAGCGVEDIAGALGLSVKDLFVDKPKDAPVKGRPPVVATYTYPNGTQKLRRADKSFSWRRPDGKGGWIYNRQGVPHSLYIAGELSGAVFICEGEKDADNLHRLGYDAVSGEDGAGPGKWRQEYTEQLRGLPVCIFQDHDDVGRTYAQETAAALYGAAASVQVLDISTVWPEIPEHGDVSDLITWAGVEKAAEMIAQLTTAPQWAPPPADSPEQPTKGRVAKAASSFGEDNTRFLWYPYLPIGDYSVMMADGGTGKTILCCGIAAAVSTGKTLPGEEFDGEGKPVLIISAEDSGEILRKRLYRSGADLDKVMILDCSDSIGMNFSDAYDEFEATVKTYAPALVIIDPWHAFLGAGVDINRVNALRPVFQKLAHLAKKCQCAMILVSHVNKRAQGENANNAATGSSDFINASRSAFRVIFDDSDEDCRVMVHTKTNYAAYGKSIRYRIDDGGVVWDGFSDVTKQTLEAAARRRSTPWEVIQGDQEHNAMHNALIEALEASTNQFVATRYSYDEFKGIHGDFIFGGSQPKKALVSVKDKLADDGYFLKTDIQVKRGDKKGRGFLIQRMDTTEPEQVEM